MAGYDDNVFDNLPRPRIKGRVAATPEPGQVLTPAVQAVRPQQSAQPGPEPSYADQLAQWLYAKGTARLPASAEPALRNTLEGAANLYNQWTPTGSFEGGVRQGMQGNAAGFVGGVLGAAPIPGAPGGNVAARTAEEAVASMTSKIPQPLVDAYNVGKRVAQFHDAGHSLNDVILGGMLSPGEQSSFDDAVYGGNAANAFLESGRAGLPMPSPAKGMRYGSASADGTSWNFADNSSEPGVSFAYVDHPSVSDYRWYNMGGSSGDPRYYSGYLLHGRTGSEGEPLMVGLSPTDKFNIPPDPAVAP